MTRPIKSRDIRAARQQAADRDLFFMAQAFGHGTPFGEEEEPPIEDPKPDERIPIGPLDCSPTT